MITMLAAILIITMVSVALVGLMNTDLTHASIEHGVARSFYIAQAGLEEAKVQVSGAAEPAGYTTPAAGVAVPYGGGGFTYWVDAGPATGCGDGLKTLESVGHVGVLGRMFWTRVRACALPGTPLSVALFGVSRVELQGISRIYLPPSQVGAPGGGGNLGSFTEIGFPDQDVRLNALSEEAASTVTLRDGRFLDYELYGFSERPDFNAHSTADATPWILGAFGDIIKARPPSGQIPNRCGNLYGCVTVGDGVTDTQDVAALREANDVRHVYVRSFRQETVPELVLNATTFRTRAAKNTANSAINRSVGLPAETGSLYTRLQFFAVIDYLAAHPEQSLQGVVYIDGTVEFIRSVTLGGNSGSVTLAVGGDLIIDRDVTVTNRHDLLTVAGRRAPGILVFGSSAPAGRMITVCGGQPVNESGRLIVCDGSALVADGLIYTQDGMAVEPGALVDEVGAMYHQNRGTSNASFTAQDATVVLRFDPLALSAFEHGVAILSWQQLH